MNKRRSKLPPTPISALDCAPTLCRGRILSITEKGRREAREPLRPISSKPKKYPEKPVFDCLRKRPDLWMALGVTRFCDCSRFGNESSCQVSLATSHDQQSRRKQTGTKRLQLPRILLLSQRGQARSFDSWCTATEAYIARNREVSDALKRLILAGCDKRESFRLLYTYSRNRIQPRVKPVLDDRAEVGSHIRALAEHLKNAFAEYRYLRRRQDPLDRVIFKALFSDDFVNMILYTAGVASVMTEPKMGRLFPAPIPKGVDWLFEQLRGSLLLRSVEANDLGLWNICDSVQSSTGKANHADVARLLDAAWVGHGMKPGWTPQVVETQLYRAKKLRKQLIELLEESHRMVSYHGRPPKKACS